MVGEEEPSRVQVAGGDRGEGAQECFSIRGLRDMLSHEVKGDAVVERWEDREEGDSPGSSDRKVIGKDWKQRHREREVGAGMGQKLEISL